MGIYNHPIFVSTTSGFPIQQDNEEIPKTSLDATSKRLQDNINPTTNCPLISIPFVKKMVEDITIFCILYYFVYRIFFPFPMSWTFLVEIGILLLYIYHVRLSLVYHFSSFLRRIYEFSLPFILVSEKVLKPQFSLTSIILH